MASSSISPLDTAQRPMKRTKSSLLAFRLREVRNRRPRAAPVTPSCARTRSLPGNWHAHALCKSSRVRPQFLDTPRGEPPSHEPSRVPLAPMNRPAAQPRAPTANGAPPRPPSAVDAVWVRARAASSRPSVLVVRLPTSSSVQPSTLTRRACAASLCAGGLLLLRLLHGEVQAAGLPGVAAAKARRGALARPLGLGVASCGGVCARSAGVRREWRVVAVVSGVLVWWRVRIAWALGMRLRTCSVAVVPSVWRMWRL